MTQPVLFEVEDQIAWITLNRPERRNAINQALLVELYKCIDTIAKDDTIRVGIITGNGTAFSSGVDLDCLKTDRVFDPRGDGTDMPDVFNACSKPLIGAINGYAITGGFEIALNCDFLIASEKALFADTHAKVGIHPGWGMTQLLQKAVGQSMAKQMSLSCDFIDANTAYKFGLVNEVVSPEKLINRVREIALKICETKEPMAKKVKTLIENSNKTTSENAAHLEREGFAQFVQKNFPEKEE